MFRRACLGLVIGLAALGGPGLPGGGAPAAAQSAPTGSGTTGYQERNVWAGYREPPVSVITPATGLPARPARFCLRLPLPNQEAPPTGQGSYTAAEMRALASRTPIDRTPGAWHTLVCYETGEDLPYLVTLAVWNPRDPTAGNATTIEGVEDFARDLLDTPAPQVSTSPPAPRQVTGLETWFAAGVPAVLARSAQAGPLWATAEAEAVAVELDPGDGGTGLRCTLGAGAGAGAGSPAAPSVAPECLRHTYVGVDRRTGTATVTARVRVRYRVYLTTSEDPTRRPVDDLLGDVAEVALTVREIQTVLR